MTQILKLQITPLLQLEASPTKGTELTGLATETQSNYEKKNLLIEPGRKSEIILQIQNVTDYLIQLQIQVKGDFPANCCSWNLEGNSILPRQTMLVGINFQIAQDFFENNEIKIDQAGLKIDYESIIYLHYQIEGTERQYLETIKFNLYIRDRSLYLQFLPAIYKEVDFIGRFLKIFEQTFEPSVKTLEALWAYLDPLTAPETLLPFLAHWVGWEMISNLDIFHQRRLIRNAIEIYKWRGTKKGLRFYLHLYTGLPLDEELTESNKHISIEEMSTLGFVLGNAHLGEETVLGGGRPYHFNVRLRKDSTKQIDESLVRLIIEQEKPAWCTYELYIKENDQ